MVGRCQEIGFRIIGVPDRNFYGFGLDTVLNTQGLLLLVKAQ